MPNPQSKKRKREKPNAAISPAKTRSRGPAELTGTVSPEKAKVRNFGGMFNQYLQSPDKQHSVQILKRRKTMTAGAILCSPPKPKHRSPLRVISMTPKGKTVKKFRSKGGVAFHLRLKSSETLIYSTKENIIGSIKPPKEPTLETLNHTTTITLKNLEFMAKHSRYHKGQRSPTQKALFNYKSANEIALLSSYKDQPGIKSEKQFCHIVAFSLGGNNSHLIVKSNHNRYQKKILKNTPQNKKNLFIGTEACNGQMIVVEKCITFLLVKGYADRIELSTELTYEKDKIHDVMFGHQLKYHLKAYQGEKLILDDCFEFSPLSYDKPLRSMPKALRKSLLARIKKQEALEVILPDEICYDKTKTISKELIVPKLYRVDPTQSSQVAELRKSKNVVLQTLIKNKWQIKPSSQKTDRSLQDLLRNVQVRGRNFDPKTDKTTDLFLEKQISDPKNREYLKTFYNQSLISLYHAIFASALDTTKQIFVSDKSAQINITEKNGQLFVTTRINSIPIIDIDSEAELTVAGSVEIKFLLNAAGATLQYIDISNPTLREMLFHQDKLTFGRTQLQQAALEHQLSEIAVKYDLHQDIRDFFEHLYSCNSKNITVEKQQAIMEAVTKYLKAPSSNKDDAFHLFNKMKTILANKPISIKSFAAPSFEILAGAAVVGAGHYFGSKNSHVRGGLSFFGGVLMADAIGRYQTALFGDDEMVKSDPALQQMLNKLTIVCQTKQKILQAQENESLEVPKAPSLLK